MTEKGYYIDSLPGTGLVTFLALVKEKEIRPKRAGGWYLYLSLGDRTGEIEAKARDQPQEIAALFNRDDIVPALLRAKRQSHQRNAADRSGLTEVGRQGAARPRKRRERRTPWRSRPAGTAPSRSPCCRVFVPAVPQ